MQYTARNYETIKNALNDDKAFSIARLGGKHVGKPAVCIGSGPTLTPSLPYLKEWQEQTGGIIYCGLSNINLLMSAGIKPTYFVIYDFRDRPDDPPSMALSTEPDFYKGIPMIISPEYDPGMIKFWLNTGNPIYFAMRGAGGNPDTDPYISYLHRLLPAIYAQNEEIKAENRLFTGFINVGCVANQEIFCATVMGCDPIYICGVNLGYPENKAHIKPMIRKDGKFVEQEYVADFTEPMKGQCYADNGVLTDTINLMYKHATLFIWMSNRLDLYELTIDGLYGILDVLPKIDIKDLVAGKAVHIKVTMQERQKIMQEYRKNHNYKEIKFGEGSFDIPEEEGGDVAGTEYYTPAEPIEGGVDPMTLK